MVIGHCDLPRLIGSVMPVMLSGFSVSRKAKNQTERLPTNA
jgi:hypothetical protein